MKVRVTSALVASTCLMMIAGGAGPAAAGMYGDQLSKCLVESTSQKDRTVLIRWVFAAMASHPEVSSLAAISDARGAELNREAGALFTKLLSESCASETRQALKAEGNGVMESSFNVLGQIAMQGLMTDPAVASYMAGLEAGIDGEKLEAALGTP